MDFAVAFAQLDHPFGALVGVSFGRDLRGVPDTEIARLPLEEQAVAMTLRGFRQVQWVAARLAWRVVASKLGYREAPLLATDEGAPRGPTDLSISAAHKRDIAIVLAGPRSGGMLGVDIEDDAAAAESIEELVFSDDERARFARMNATERSGARVVAFSLKESIYKASSPADQRVLTYTDASVAFDEAGKPRVTMQAPFAGQMDIWSGRHGTHVVTAVRRSPSTR